ncbi:MAG: nitrogenase component 1 [Elusimicrobiota bacterium]|jgi:nitrogenase molybdenum-iron protein alpha/beta subunit
MDLNADPLSRLPFLNGVYIAVDAVPGAFLVVDGPYCVFTKAEMQYGHNLACRLIPPLGRAAVVHTAARTGMEEVTSLSSDRVPAVAEVFRRVCAYPEAEVVFAASFDFHELLNFPLAETARAAGKASGRLVCPLPPSSLSGSWLDGYAAACAALAREVPLARGRGRKDTVGVVGYLFDRDEPDHRGNLAELRRLFSGLGLKLAPVWLSGSGLSRLAAIESASLIVSLPYGRSAARTLGRRLKARVVEAGLPLGLTATEDFVRTVASAAGWSRGVDRFLEREAASAVRDTREHVTRVICGRTAVLLLPDPHLARALAGLAEDLGLRTAAAGTPDPETEGAPLLIGPRRRGAGPGIVISFGYPNYEDHPVVARPFLGYAGFRSLVETLTERILAYEAGTESRAEARR